MTEILEQRIREYYQRLLEQTGSPHIALEHTVQRFGIPAWQLPSILADD